ncbi:hypothetical protein APASM_4830 [Actinosynnema pretiosum subsp. pretiosum]|nr:hypothetical protein APASM_4830 [Actinosynnema pretiosum subsp. pretiosum]
MPLTGLPRLAGHGCPACRGLLDLRLVRCPRLRLGDPFFGLHGASRTRGRRSPSVSCGSNARSPYGGTATRALTTAPKGNPTTTAATTPTAAGQLQQGNHSNHGGAQV